MTSRRMGEGPLGLVAGLARRRGALLVGSIAVALTATSVPALAAPQPSPTSPPASVVLPAPETPVPVHAVTPRRVATPHMPAYLAPTPSPLPAAETADLVVTYPKVAIRRGTLTQAGTLPIRLGAPTPGSPTSRVRVRLAPQSVSSTSGVAGYVFTLKGLGLTKPHRVTVAIDYSALAAHFGGDTQGRMELVALPACALTTPSVAACRTRSTIPFTNNQSTTTLAATVAVGSSTTLVLAAAATTGGGGGDYSATSLTPSGKWSVSGGTGAFSWTYPINVPVVPGALAPEVALGYSSQAVDGLTSATNAQASWIGDGWDYSPGYIERSYQSCTQNPAGTTKTSDQCWSDSNVLTLSLGGHSTTLVKDDATGTWHPQTDNGEVVSFRTGATNGDHDGDYWVITTQDGKQYTFGLNQLPGWTTGQATTNSTLTEPVFATKTGQPCYNATWANSWCAKAYRWNLDYVVDSHSDAIAYYYGNETNFYARNNGATATSYVRGGYLKEIDYGFRAGQAYSTTALPPAKVTFGVTGRCDLATCDPATLTTATASHWPDVPFNLNCASGTTCTTWSPTFWTVNRLASVTTSVLVGTTYTPVDTWALARTFPAPGDATTPALWLSSIVHSGLDGGTLALPPITFSGQAMANRVNGTDGYQPLTRYRLTTVTTETGQIVGVNYTNAASAGTACSYQPTVVLPAAADANTMLCYPMYWTRPGTASPAIDWFNKYVVSAVVSQDPTAAGPAMGTYYTYLGGTAWHFDDNPLVPAANRTWSQWRGFTKVEVRTGSSPDPVTLTRSTYYRGMDADPLTSGVRTATVTDSLNETVPDSNWLAGTTREQSTYNGDTTTRVNTTITDPWASAVTATHARTGLTDLTSRFAGNAKSRTLTDLAAGGTRLTETDYTHDALGRITLTNDLGDTAVAADDLCTRITYTGNTTGIVVLPSETRTVSVNCSTTPAFPGNAVSDELDYYDLSQVNGATPTIGDQTLVKQATSYTGTTPNYITTMTVTSVDVYGRRLKYQDANNNITTTTYTPATGAMPTTMAMQDAKLFTTTTTFDPLRGLALSIVDPNAYTISETWDPLGRLLKVWKPGNPKATGAADIVHTYTVNNTAPSVVTTANLNDNGTYRISESLYDSILRTRETQVGTPDGNRIITDATYDSHGWVQKTNNSYSATGAPAATLVQGADAQIPSQVVNTYDGDGRLTVAKTYSLATFKWQSAYSYGGNFTTSIPPTGGTATTTYTDGRNRATSMRQYHSFALVDPINAPRTAYDLTSYTYTPASRPATTVDDQGDTWNNAWDLLGRRVGTTDPDGGAATSSYDNNGNLLTNTDSRSKQVTYTYDALNRKTFAYDTTGNATPSTTNMLESRVYDSLKKNQPTSSTTYSNGFAYTSAILSYDSHDRVAASRITIPADPANGASLAPTPARTLTTWPEPSQPELTPPPAASQPRPSPTDTTPTVDPPPPKARRRGTTSTSSPTHR
jgi:YD repeat-containing protein